MGISVFKLMAGELKKLLSGPKSKADCVNYKGNFTITPSALGAEETYINFHPEQVAEENYQPGLGEKVLALAKKVVPVAAAASVVAIPLIMAGQADAGVDPLQFVPSNATYTSYQANPYLGAGKLAGGDFADNGANVWIMWQDGHAEKYSPTNIFGTSLATMEFGGSLNTSLTLVSPSYLGLGASFAVSDASNINFYDANGKGLGLKHISGVNISAITYDVQRDRLLVASTGSTGILVPGEGNAATLNPFYSGYSTGTKAINMTTDGLDNAIDDLYFNGGVAVRFSETGELTDNFKSCFTGPTESIIPTVDNLIRIRDTGVYTYNKMDFQNHMDYSVPEPATYPLGDLTHDIQVNLEDFAVFASAWLSAIEEAAYDPACELAAPADGVINIQDLVVFAEAWLIQ